MTAADQAIGGPGDDQTSPTRQYVGAGLELLGLNAGEAEFAVIEAVDGLYRPLIEALLEVELDGIEPEPGADMSRKPRSLDER